MGYSREAKGFTLIELIITISILAILVAILIIALNPAEQLARTRDAKRVGDLDAVRAALNLYAAETTSTPSFDGVTGTSINDLCKNGASAAKMWVNTGGPVTEPTGFTRSGTTTQTVGSAGWIPARVNEVSGGSPVSNLPLDPTNGTGNSTSYFYAYACEKNNKRYELTARLESSYFASDLDLDNIDGGNATSTYEVGTDLTILPAGF